MSWKYNYYRVDYDLVYKGWVVQKGIFPNFFCNWKTIEYCKSVDDAENSLDYEKGTIVGYSDNRRRILKIAK